MKGRALTTPQKDLHNQLRQMGCAVCKFCNGVNNDFDNMESETAIHHLEGKTKPMAHWLVIPLCPCHHQYGCNQNGTQHVGLHSHGKKAFKRQYGYDEYELMALCGEELGWEYSEGCFYTPNELNERAEN